MSEDKRLTMWGFAFIIIASSLALCGDGATSLSLMIVAAIHFVGASICEEINKQGTK